MNKRTMIGLISGTVLIWTSVLVVFLLNMDAKEFNSKEHSFTRSIHTESKSWNDQLAADFFKRSLTLENKAQTIIGEKTLTKTWVDDVRKDGKLSIDTLLKSLELKDSDNS